MTLQPNPTPLIQTPTKKRLIRKKKQTEATPIPVKKKKLRMKKTVLEPDVVEVLVKPWRCCSNNLHYLLDPITQEVFDKFTHSYIGIRYKDNDEVSLIDFE